MALQDFIGDFYSPHERVLPERKKLLNPLDVVVEDIFTEDTRLTAASQAAACAVFTAIAVAGRGVFFWAPFIKPVCALVILAGISFGAGWGFVTGAMAMLISNFMFGQGPWTIFQMLGMGMAGAISGLLTQSGFMPVRRVTLSLTGAVITIIIYGGIVNLSTLVFAMYDVSWQMVMALYLSGISVDIIHGVGTFVFLWILSGSILKETGRIKRRFGECSSSLRNTR